LAAPASDPNLARARAALAQIPLHFEANQGQWNPEVRYVARSARETFFLTEQGPVLATASHRVDIGLVRSNPAPRIEPLNPLSGKTNYFVGHQANWRPGVTQYARIAYRSVYPGVDVIYYGKANQLEYDLVLQPGADARAIQWKFRGADHLRLTPDGDLEVQSAGAQFVQKRPVLYQQGHAIGGRYTLLGQGRVGVHVDAYDHARELVIDPVLSYGSFLGGGSTDVINAMKIDSKGRMYVAGYTAGNDLPANFMQGGNAGATDCFIAILDTRFSGATSLPILTYLGGGRNDSCTALNLDSAGNIYVTGTTTSSDFPLAGNSVQTTLNLSTTNTVFEPDAFVCEIDPVNGLAYSTYFGGTGAETPSAISVDQNGLIYVLGTTTSADMPVTSSAYQSVQWGPSDIFILKLDPNATSPVYASYLGGEDEEDGRGLAVTPAGLVYFAASTLSQAFPLAGSPYNNTLLGIESVVIGVMDLTQTGSASLVYSTYLGGSVLDEVRKIALDPQGRLLVTGWTLSPDFPTTANAFQTQSSGSGTAFIARVNPSAGAGKFLDYSTYFGGTGGDVAYDIASDANGSIYVAGYTLSKDFPITSDAVQAKFGNGIEAFVAKLNPAVAGRGALQYSSYFGTGGIHVVTGLAVAPNGSIYLAGYTTDQLPVTDNAFQNGFAGGSSDGFVFAVQ
jgi:hypothetical protein